MISSPTTTGPDVDAVFVKVEAGKGAFRATVSSAVKSARLPPAGVEDIVAVLAISVAASKSAWVMTYVAVKSWEAPGAIDAVAGDIADNVPEPPCASDIDTLFKVTLPVLVAV